MFRIVVFLIPMLFANLSHALSLLRTTKSALFACLPSTSRNSKLAHKHNTNKLKGEKNPAKQDQFEKEHLQCKMAVNDYQIRTASTMKY